MSIPTDDKVRQSFAREGTLKGAPAHISKFEHLEPSIQDENSDPLLPGAGTVRDGLKAINFSAYSVGHVYYDF